jgi:hypothetical protein
VDAFGERHIPHASAIRAVLPWRRQDDAARPIAVRALPSHAELAFLVLNATGKECDLVINPTPLPSTSGLLPRPWLQNAAFSWLGSNEQYLGNVAKYINGTLAASTGSLPGWGPRKAMDGLIDFADAPSEDMCTQVPYGH